jgi:hypothetical protein
MPNSDRNGWLEVQTREQTPFENEAQFPHGLCSGLRQVAARRTLFAIPHRKSRSEPSLSPQKPDSVLSR